MFYQMPEGYVPVPNADFEEYLRTCDDYVRDGWANGCIYRFRHNNEKFAYYVEGKDVIMINPNILQPKLP